ncbi:hypothetical protein YC2023_066381 [Brassica napus]
MSVGVRQHTQNVCGCLWLSVITHMTSLAVRVCPSAHTGRPWLSISTHISTLVLGLSTLTLPMDCLGDFGPRGLSVQFTQDVRGCPPAHTGHPWLSICVRVCPSVSVNTHMTSVAVHQYTYQHVHTRRPCVFSSIHRTSMGVRQHTKDVRGCPCVFVYVRQHIHDVPGCPSVHISARWKSVCIRQHTQDVRGCPSAYTERLRLSISSHISTHRTSVAVCVCPCVSACVRQHTHDVRGCPSVDISARWTSMGVRQHTQDVRVCPSAHTGRSWLSVSTHRTSVTVHQFTYQHAQDVRGCLCVSVCVRVCPSAHTGCPWLSISTHISTLVLGLSTLALPVQFSGDFGPRGLSVQYTQDVRGCPPAHTGRMWLSVAVPHHTHDISGCPTLTLPMDCLGDFGPRGLSVQFTQDVRGCPPAHTGHPWLSICVRVCPSVSVNTHMTSVAVHQYTYQHYTHDVRVCSSAHTERPWLSASTHRTFVAVRVCSCMSVSTYMTSLAVHQYTYQHAVHTGRPCVSVSTHRTSVAVRQHTQNVCGCPSVHISAHTGRPLLSVFVRVCPRVSVSTHMMSVAVHQYIYQHAGPWTQHAGPSRRPCVSVSTHWTSVAVRQHTQNVCGCPSVHISARIGRPWLSVLTVCVRVCPSAHTGCPWLSISTHISTLVLGLSTLALPVQFSGDFGPRGLSVQYTQDVRGCPPAHTGRMWLSVAVPHHTHDISGCPYVSVCVRQRTQDVRGCPSVHISARWSLNSARWPFPWAVPVILAHVGCLFSTHMTSVCVRQHTQDVRVCPSANTGRLWLSVSTHRTSVVVRQHTQDVCGCPCVSLLAAFFLGGKGQQLAVGSAEAALHMSFLSLALC